MEVIGNINSAVNRLVWGPCMLLLLLGTGVFYTVKLRGFQLFRVREWWSCTFMSMFRRNGSAKSGAGISPLQAVSTALAGSVGTGNIVGVANAIALGGAGAVFWMWAAAFFGMATVFAENVLGIKYRIRKNGKFIGGPMYYIEKGLGCKWLAVVFAAACTAASLGMGNMTQSNSAAGALEQSFGIPCFVSGAALSVIAGIMIFGGIGRIAGFTEKLVPIMTALYITGVTAVIVINHARIPSALSAVFTQAFDLRAVSGGAAGCVMMQAVKYGVSRGVFSNEAGLGTSPIVHSAAETDDPCRQGYWGVFQVFVDTIVLCTLMALCILTADCDISGLDGIRLSTIAFEKALGGAGGVFMSAAIALFAFGTLISWSYYGEKSLEYLTGGRFITSFRLVYILFIFIGCVTSLSLVWEISDTLNGIMAIPNIAALILLSGRIKYSELMPLTQKPTKLFEDKKSY